MRLMPRRRQTGFTLIEAIVVVFIIGVLMMIALPGLTKMLLRAKLRATAREVAAAMQMAKIQAARRGADTRVMYDPSSNMLVAFIDNVPKLGAPPASPFPITAPDILLATVAMPKGVGFWGPGDAAIDATNAVQGFDAVACDTPARGPIFISDGSVRCAGALRIATINSTADEGDNSFLEVRISPRATARVHIQKFFPGEPIANCTNDDPKVGGCWFEFDELGHAWKWP